MRENLEMLAALLRRFLSAELPALGPDWWDQGVLGNLTFQQRAQAQEHGWTSLDDLDVAATIRIVDRNWDLFRRRSRVRWEDRNWLKEASSIRNRYSHQAPGREPSADRIFRDLDTLTLLAESIDSGSTEANRLADARTQALAAILPSPSSDARTAAQPSAGLGEDGFALGSMVRVKARPELMGAVIRVDQSGGRVRLAVFHGGMTQTYYRDQVELVEAESADRVSADEFKAKLTGVQVLHPSVSRLYSLNSGRIDYEPYQYRPVMKLITADRPRLLIADEVGVGKTIEAGLIIKELQARQRLDSILVICPKPLIVENKWRGELKRFDEDFAHLDSATLRHCIDEMRAEGRWPSRYKKAILPYSLLDEKLLLGDESGRRKRPGLVSLLPPVKFDLVIVDEAHHVRNTNTWSHRVVKHLLESAEAAVLISATPIQTGNEDLRTLLGLLRPDTFVDSQAFDLMREPNEYVAATESAIRVAEEGWQSQAIEALSGAMETPWGARVLRADPRTQELVDLLGREEVGDEERVKALRLAQTLNTFSGLINRTRRRDIGSFTQRKPETFEVDFTPAQQAVHDSLLDLASRIAKARGLGQSIDFLLSTLQRQAASSLNGLAPFIEDVLSRRLTAEELSEADVELEALDPTLLEGFFEEIRQVGERASALTEDPKAARLLAYVEEKRHLENDKLLVFSTFRHTLQYLLDLLAVTGVRVGLVHGGVPDDERRDIRARFAKKSSEPDAIDVLLSSEVGTEGLDYQFCDALVNYDLPWNPMRIEQRIGRIDRRGQPSESVAIKNLIVSGTVDAAIFQRCLTRIGVFERAIGGSEAILGELTREIRTIGEDLTLTVAEREARLRHLADNRIGRIQEQAALEERESDLFGLPLRRLDAEGIEQAASPWLAVEQLARLVRRYLADRGYERADSLFERPVAVLRPTKDVRKALLEDAQALSPEVTSTWRRYLENGAEQSRRLTFDPALADEEVELLSPVHDLVRVAAAHQGEFASESTVHLRVKADSVPEGRYPVAVSAWTYLGARDDFEVILTSLDPALDDAIQDLLLEAADADSADTFPSSKSDLDDRVYELWADARATHIEKTDAHVKNQIASLTTTHLARVQLLEDQISRASHDNIRRMRESELRSAEEEFDARMSRLRESALRADITTMLLCTGLIEVIND